MISMAAEFRAGEQASISKNEKIVNDVYIAGGSVTSSGNIKGDLITGGGNVVITGDVESDVIAGGGNITILSNIGDDVRVGGGTIIITGKIGGDLIAGGGQINITGAGIGGDVAIGAGDVRIDAPVAGNLFIAGGNVFINAPIGGDVKIQAEKVTLGSAAVISGNLAYKASNELVKEEGAIVKGVVDFQQIENKKTSARVLAAMGSAFLLWKFLAILVCALLVGLVFRRYTKEVIILSTKRPLYELGKGVIIAIVVPIISVFLLVTLLGIPLGILGLLCFILMMFLACIIAPIVVGSVVYSYFSKKEFEVSWQTILLGVFLWMLLGLIPFIGWLILILVMFIVLGSLVTLEWRIYKEWR